LRFRYNGWFCDRHLRQLARIRYRLCRVETWRDELALRREEIRLRGSDAGHDACVQHLEKRLFPEPVTHHKKGGGVAAATYAPLEPVKHSTLLAPGLVAVW